ncbi:MAG: hypothetical protein J2P23_00320 [Microlunatus sp.]|nr:hypothetical protein [Microlunatus sp.]
MTAVTPGSASSAVAADPSSASEARLAALADVVRAAIGDVPIQDSIPDDASRAVALVPLALSRLGRVRDLDTIVQLSLRLLVVTSGPSPLADLEVLLVAFDQVSGLEIERAEPPLELWSILEARPRPAVLVRLDVPITLPATPAPLVLHPMRVDTRMITSREGVLIGPNGSALPYGVVTAPSYDCEVLVDGSGRFQLPLPADEDHVALIVNVRGRTFTVDAPIPQQGLILVNCNREETS